MTARYPYEPRFERPRSRDEANRIAAEIRGAIDAAINQQPTQEGTPTPMTNNRHKLRRALAGAAIVTAIGAATAGTASAHSNNITAVCGKLTFKANSDYEGNATNNKVTITIDGAATSTLFGSSGVTLPATLTKYEAHTWSVAVDANINTGNKTAYDVPATANGYHGTIAACETPPTTVPPTTTTPPTTTPPTTVPPTTTPATTTPPTTTPPTTQPPATTTPPTTETPTTVCTDTTTPESPCYVAPTTVAPTTEPATTTPAPAAPGTTDTAPAPSVLAPTTTTVTAIIPPENVDTIELPETGTDIGEQAIAAALILAAGAALIYTRHRGRAHR